MPEVEQEREKKEIEESRAVFLLLYGAAVAP